MQQLVLFQMTAEAQSLNIAGKAKLEKQSNLSSNITASNKFFFDMEDSVEPRKFTMKKAITEIFITSTKKMAS